MIRYSQGFKRETNEVSGHTTTCVAILARDMDTREVIEAHSRAAYTGTEAAITASWLNERAQGYPVPEALKHLHNGH